MLLKKAMNNSLLLVRFVSKNTCTLGYISFNGTIICRTLEPKSCDGFTSHGVRNGLYPLKITYSPKFGKNLPLLEGVPARSGIRIHSGNTSKDTKGCILVGLHFNGESLTDSRQALSNLMQLIKEQAIEFILVSNNPESFLL